jgi:hypothetical protein
MSPTKPDLAQAESPASSGDTISVSNITNSQAVAIEPWAVAQVFQQILLPAPSDYRCAALRMIEEYEEVFGGHEAELGALDRMCRSAWMVPHTPWTPHPLGAPQSRCRSFVSTPLEAAGVRQPCRASRSPSRTHWPS